MPKHHWIDKGGAGMRGRNLLVGVAVLTLVSTGVMGIGPVASAKTKAPGCHKTHSCKNSGSGGPSAPMTIQIDPNPVIEVSSSVFAVVVQVETSPSFAGDPVTISSSQAASACGGSGEIDFQNLASGSLAPAGLTVSLDNEGNATVILEGGGPNLKAGDCAPGSSLVEADLAVAPFLTATTTLQVQSPTVTSPGLFGSPTTSGTVTGGEVETGDTPTSGDSAALAVFNVETDPVYAEQSLEVSSPELVARCGVGSEWRGDDGNTTGGPTSLPTQIDDDGDAFVEFQGESCAAGSSVVTADVEAGTHPTYTTTFNILPPQPTI